MLLSVPHSGKYPLSQWFQVLFYISPFPESTTFYHLLPYLSQLSPPDRYQCLLTIWLFWPFCQRRQIG
jgi:hypothetical protein